MYPGHAVCTLTTAAPDRTRMTAALIQYVIDRAGRCQNTSRMPSDRTGRQGSGNSQRRVFPPSTELKSDLTERTRKAIQGVSAPDDHDYFPYRAYSVVPVRMTSQAARGAVRACLTLRTYGRSQSLRVSRASASDTGAADPSPVAGGRRREVGSDEASGSSAGPCSRRSGLGGS